MREKIKATMTIGGKTVDMEDAKAAEALVRDNFGQPGEDPEQAAQPVMVRGKLIKTLLNQVTNKPKDDWPERETDSIGVGKCSISATDGFSAVIVGEPENEYRPTKRKSALLEAEREMIYGECVDFERIEQFVHPKTGELTPYPGVRTVVESHLDQMESIGQFSVERLLRILKVAAASNSDTVELFRPRKGARINALGARFYVIPDEDQMSLFGGDAEEIEAVAVVVGKSRPKDGEEE